MMTRPNTVAGLLEMHRTIAGQIEAKRTELARLVADLEAVEHTLRRATKARKRAERELTKERNG